MGMDVRVLFPDLLIFSDIYLVAFRTDTDITANLLKTVGVPHERELQAWQPSADGPPASSGEKGDELTFGAGSGSNMSWDQFETNERKFGVKASFDENVYTTKLDRTAADFKEREKRAQKIANEIVGVRLHCCWCFVKTNIVTSRALLRILTLRRSVINWETTVASTRKTSVSSYSRL